MVVLKLQDGKLHIYTRPNTKFYWCKFYHKRVPFRTSTRTNDLKKATDFAQQWYWGRQHEISTGKVAPTSNAKSFAVAAEKALDAYRRDVARGTRSQSYLTSLTNMLRNRVVPELGKYALASIGQVVWNKYQEQLMARKKPLKPRSIHQHKNAIHVVLKQAQMRGEILTMPKFLDVHASMKDDTPRTWFEADEYKKLYKALRANIESHRNTRWHEAAKELRDYVLIVTNSGLRPGEACNVRLCDVEIRKDRDDSGVEQPEHLLIKNIKGKRGEGECKSYFGAVRPFLRCVERHGLTRSNYQESMEPVFKAYHRDMFREILERTNLRFTIHRPPRRRDLMSLRHTYICYRLQNNVPVFDIAVNCRTSVEMIQNHYARWLEPSRSKSINMTAAKAVYNVTE